MLFLMAAPKMGAVKGIWELFHMSHIYLCVCERSEPEYSPESISGQVFSATLGEQRV